MRVHSLAAAGTAAPLGGAEVGGAVAPPLEPPPAAAPPAAVAPLPPAAAEEAAEDDGTHKRVMALLAGSGASYRTQEHAPTKTSEESAAVRGVPLASGAKAMLLKAGKPVALPEAPGVLRGQYILAVLSAARRCELSALKRVLGQKHMSVAPLEDLRRLTGCLPGAVPPFGSLFGVPTIIDRSILSETGGALCFNAGLRGFSVLGLPVAAYVALERPAVADFSAPQG